MYATLEQGSPSSDLLDTIVLNLDHEHELDHRIVQIYQFQLMLEAVETLGDFEHMTDWDLYLEIVTIEKTIMLYYEDFSIVKDDDTTKLLIHVDDKKHEDYILSIMDDEDQIHHIHAYDLVSIQVFS